MDSLFTGTRRANDQWSAAEKQFSKDDYNLLNIFRKSTDQQSRETSSYDLTIRKLFEDSKFFILILL